MSDSGGWFAQQIVKQADALRSWTLPGLMTVVCVVFVGQVMNDSWPMAARLALSTFFAFGAVVWLLVTIRVWRHDRPRWARARTRRS